LKLYCEHRIAREAEDLWTILHTPAFEARLASAIGLSEYTELERDETGEAVYRRIQVVPNIPGAFLSLVRRFGAGEKISYIEEQWRSKEERVVRWEMTPSLLADRTRIEGQIRIEPQDAKGCLRILDGVVEVKLPALGQAVEQAIVRSTLEAYAKSAEEASRRP
jgi:hypothetical protein